MATKILSHWPQSLPVSKRFVKGTMDRDPRQGISIKVNERVSDFNLQFKVYRLPVSFFRKNWKLNGLLQNSNIGSLLGRKLSIAFFNLFGLEAKPSSDHSDPVVMFSFLRIIVQLMLCGRAAGNQLTFNGKIFFHLHRLHALKQKMKNIKLWLPGQKRTTQSWGRTWKLGGKLVQFSNQMRFGA